MAATHLSASDLYTYYRPSACELRVFLRHRGEPEVEPGPFELLIRRLGERHERQHLATLGPLTDLSAADRAERESLTRKAVADAVPIVYQGALRGSAQFGGQAWEVVGDPDFLIRSGGGYLVRDCKLARRINTKDHPEIILSLQLYGWLFEQTFGRAPVGLEVFSGAGELVSIDQRGVVTKSMTEGGEQERELAAVYTKHAGAVSARWPRTGAVLRHIANEYEREARGEDIEVKQERR